MKIIYNNMIPFGKKFIAINIFGILFAKEHLKGDMLNHEAIHTAQMKELLYIPFYLLYFIDWTVRLFQYGFSTKAYYNISFEQEAYNNMDNLSYLSSRKPFSFVRYM